MTKAQLFAAIPTGYLGSALWPAYVKWAARKGGADYFGKVITSPREAAADFDLYARCIRLGEPLGLLPFPPFQRLPWMKASSVPFAGLKARPALTAQGKRNLQALTAR